MPRRQRRVKVGGLPRKPRQPKVPKAPKLPRPRVRDLKIVMKGLVTASIGDRIASLNYVLQWYDKVVLYLINKKLIVLSMDPNKLTIEQKRLNTAVKARKLAAETKNDHEKETALLTCVRQYEQACHAIKPTPVDRYYKMFEAKKDKLEQKQKRMEQKFGAVLNQLQTVVGPDLKITMIDARKPAQYDPPMKVLNYNRDMAKQIGAQARAEGLLPTFVSQLELLSRSAAIRPDGNGGFELDPKDQVDKMLQLLNSFVTFAKTGDAPRKLIRNGEMRVPTPRQPAVQGAPRAPRVPRSGAGPTILGFLSPGTAITTIYERLKDEAEHLMKDVIAGITVGDPVGRVKTLARKGRRNGKITVTITGDRVQLKHLVAQP